MIVLVYDSVSLFIFPGKEGTEHDAEWYCDSTSFYFFIFSFFRVSSQVEGIIVLFGLMFKNQYHILHSINNQDSINVLIGCIVDEVNAGLQRKGTPKS